MVATTQARAGVASPGRLRRRNIPLAACGVLVVLGCGLVFMVTSLHGRVPVLAAARALPAGHVLMAGDLAVVRVAAPASAGLVPERDRVSLLGRPLAGALTAGALVTRGAVGSAAVPPRGQAIVGVAVKSGGYPPDLSAGALVSTFTLTAAPTSSAPGRGGVALPIGVGTVLAVTPAAASDTVVVELQVRADDVPQLNAASAAGTVSLALTGASS